MKNFRISSFIFWLILIFLAIDFMGYRLIHKDIVRDHEKSTEILFYKIRSQSSDLLSKLLYDYSKQKQTLIEKHKIVQEYLRTRPLDLNLTNIYEKINEGHPDKPYNIYLADKNLIIRNTSFVNDLGFDLSFAKQDFEKHYAQKVIGCSIPILENTTNQFLSYSDSYLSADGDDKAALLQVSYTYRESNHMIARLKELIEKNPAIVNAESYSFGDGHFIYEIILKEAETAKLNMESKEYEAREKQAQTLLGKLRQNHLREEKFVKNGIHYKSLSLMTGSPVSSDKMIMYSIVFDESDLYRQLRNLDIFIVLISLAGIVGIIVLAKLRKKEGRLSQQDEFVQHAMHEIKTPLSVITLNNELRQMELGNDSYGKEINSALKALHNSYASMGFIVTKDKLEYETEILDLAQITKERVDFFQSIAAANDKEIVASLKSDCLVEISLVELVRLIDNNLSNAVKYSEAGDCINVVLDGNRLSFLNKGSRIHRQKKIFEKYYRENHTVGGYGLGLSIVKDIAKKYDIAIELQSDADNGTRFIYSFKCHNDVIS